MAHFAKVVNGTVERVIVAEPEFINTFVDDTPGEWIQTSYNTRFGKHYAPNSTTEDSGTPLRKNYAWVGGTYDKTRDAFIPPKPFESWVLNESTCVWDPPVAYPSDGKGYDWNESSKSWVEETE
tara:strand:+ start:238 stop:609 length:372 start_codon:yes stop_codon:yes gene_type:complete